MDPSVVKKIEFKSPGEISDKNQASALKVVWHVTKVFEPEESRKFGHELIHPVPVNFDI